jgi:hypothetical protein
MVASASNRTANTSDSKAASAYIIRKPETRHFISGPVSIIDIVDGSNENSQGILIV